MPTVGNPDVSLSPMQLIQMAVQNGGAIEQLEKLMELQERWEEKEARKAYFDSLTQFQSQMPIIEKKKTVAFNQTNYKYAPLDDIMEQIRPSLKANGLTVRWEQEQKDNDIIVTCIITHKLGHSERVRLSGNPDVSGKKNSVQSIASTVTYLRRYTVTGALGIATADEDFDGRIEKNEDRQAKEIGNFNFYSDSSFEENFPKWEKSIKSGKIGVEGVINKIQSKFTLTDYQIKQLESLK